MLKALKENAEVICKFMDEPYSGGTGKYHSSWEWLMPILVQIDNHEDVYQINITNDSIIICYGDEDIFVERQFGEELLNSMYRLVVKFIKHVK